VGAWDDGGWQALEPSFEFSSRLAKAFGARGAVMAVSTTCTSGFSALDIALGLIAEGEFRDVLVLGVEFCNRLTVAGFAGLQLLSATAARPCDRERDGLVLGEALVRCWYPRHPRPGASPRSPPGWTRPASRVRRRTARRLQRRCGPHWPARNGRPPGWI